MPSRLDASAAAPPGLRVLVTYDDDRGGAAEALYACKALPRVVSPTCRTLREALVRSHEQPRLVPEDDGLDAIAQVDLGEDPSALLDEPNHTSASAEYLAATGYAGGERYVDERAVVDGDLITAGPQSPVRFTVATLKRLGLASERTDAYEGLFHRGDPAAFPVLMQA